MIEIAGGILIAMFVLFLLGWMLNDPGSFFGTLLILGLALLGVGACVLKAVN